VYLTKAGCRRGRRWFLAGSAYYNKPTQEGLFQHFKAIAEATQLPLVLYSIPGRCGVEIAVETVNASRPRARRSSASKKRVAIPIGLANFGGVGRGIYDFVRRRFSHPPFMAVGADGVVSVASNIIPRQIAQMVTAFGAGKIEAGDSRSIKSSFRCSRFCSSRRSHPHQSGLAMLGEIEEEYRLPLVPMAAKNRDTLKATLHECGCFEMTRIIITGAKGRMGQALISCAHRCRRSRWLPASIWAMT